LLFICGRINTTIYGIAVAMETYNISHKYLNITFNIEMVNI